MKKWMVALSVLLILSLGVNVALGIGLLTDHTAEEFRLTVQEQKGCVKQIVAGLEQRQSPEDLPTLLLYLSEYDRMLGREAGVLAVKGETPQDGPLVNRGAIVLETRKALLIDETAKLTDHTAVLLRVWKALLERYEQAENTPPEEFYQILEKDGGEIYNLWSELT